MEYNFRDIEKKWQSAWTAAGAYKVSNDSPKPKFYVLDMFPYPSGAGLHVGHPLGYIASDIYARYKRLKGFNVLHPMGYDSFGLPAEQYALETGQHPAVTTEKNIATFRSQLDKIGFCFDWSREVRTSDPNYYKWTQWIFLQLFKSWFNPATNKAESVDSLIGIFEREGNGKVNPKALGPKSKNFDADEWKAFTEQRKLEELMDYRLAFSSYGEVNWCEALGTVLANDEVVNGVSERGGFPVVKKKMRQWYLRITAYADRLLEGLEKVEFSESLKEQQRNWIGKSQGAEITFDLTQTLSKGEGLAPVPPLPGRDGGEVLRSDASRLTVYTTRPDTIFGVDFMVIAPEHELVQQITTPGQKEAIDKYLEYVKSRSDRERMSEVKQVTGCFTGAYAINPFDGRQIPIWIAEYVLAGYGTGAIMAVPCGDQRDYDFAKHFNIPITNIIGDAFDGKEANPTKDAKLTNSGFLNGMVMRDAIYVVITKLVEMGIGKRQINYKMRDAGFSRQRYWGEPFPIVWIDGGAYPLDEKDLPLELPHVDKYGPGPMGEGPLANLTEWTSSPALLRYLEKGAPVHRTSQAQATGVKPYDVDDETSGVEEPVPHYSVYSPKQYELAKEMRKGHIEAENKLWQELRNNQLGEKFRRQHPIDQYIVDFICLQKRLIIEVDGGYHIEKEQQEYDATRAKKLNEIGFEVIRFNKDDVIQHTKEVINKIKASITEQTFKIEKTKTLSEANPHHPTKKEITGGEAPLSTPSGEGPGVRETSTMPGYAGSSWYFLRYMDPHNDNTFCDRKVSDYWNQVDVYVGGTEHAVGHLLYSRMWTKVLFDLGLIGFDEPYKRLVNQGMITGRSYFFQRDEQDRNQLISYTKQDEKASFERFKYGHNYVDGNNRLTKNVFKKYLADHNFKEADFAINWLNYGQEEYIVLKEETEKMSKSKFNVDNPDDLVNKFGADTFRMYEMFLGPVEASKPWDTKGIEGVHRFLKKLWRLFNDELKGKVWNNETATADELKILHRAIRKIEDDTERFSFNTAVSSFMICVNELNDIKCHKKEILENILILLTPYAPHIAEELWQQLGNSGSVLDASYPVFNASHVTESSKEYPVSINGKVRTNISIALDIAQPEVEAIVLANETVQKWLEGKSPKKIIYVKNKMVNVVV